MKCTKVRCDSASKLPLRKLQAKDLYKADEEEITIALYTKIAIIIPWPPSAPNNVVSCIVQ